MGYSSRAYWRGGMLVDPGEEGQGTPYQIMPGDSPGVQESKRAALAASQRPAQPTQFTPTAPPAAAAPQPAQPVTTPQPTVGAGQKAPDLGKPGDYYWNRLRNILDNPGDTASNPAYKFGFDQGQEAMNRTAAAKRMRFSGKSLTDATQFGQDYASTQFKSLADTYRGAASDELNRWAVPAGLSLQGYGAETSRMGAETGRMNAGTQQFSADTDRWYRENLLSRDAAKDAYGQQRDAASDAGSSYSAQRLNNLLSQFGY